MAIVEVLCHEITEADIKKIQALSNDAKTGGGARDLRFSAQFIPVLDRFFPSDVTYERNTPYRIGEFEHTDIAGNKTIQQIRYAFQPTNARPNEVRLAQINKTELFSEIPDIEEGDGLLFIALVRRSDGMPQAQYLTQRQISDPTSNKIIAAAMDEAISNSKGNSAIIFSAELRV